MMFLSVNLGISQIPELLKKEVQYRVKNHINPSIAVGLTDSTGTHFYVHGWRDLEKQVKADQHTLYEIGSITKSFTGLLLAKYVVEDSLSLSQKVNEFLPDSIDLTDKKGNPVTLKSLATHSSGLPRLPSNLDLSNQLNPYADYDQSKMYSFLSHHIPRSVGENFVYSNLGFGLLGDVLSTYKQIGFRTLVRDQILKPLQLSDTYFDVSSAEKHQLAKGYIGTQNVPHWNFKVMDAAGGLKTTITDLQRFGKQFLETSSPFAKSNKVATKSYFTDKDGNHYGLGWFIDQDGIVFHGGGTGGFRTFIAIDLNSNRVISVMTNSGSSSIEDLAKYLINPKAYPLQIDKEEVAISKEQLQPYQGEYINDGLGLNYSIVLKDDHLYAKLNQQPEFPIFYQGGESFIYKVVKAEVVFEKDENNTVVGLLLNQNGQEIQFVKTNP
ncbi:beta-lactamase [Galbibacter marinus]|uniref:Beta-lactamase n=1 Tax=Galbibacter marinus TaxID=555500 RepID=K2P2G7_9FLAO|nr:serine hydrolase domain-containing protein [Galbibacter marinus]EKF55228.1 beta-lactamase [Galbibacter marinus]